MISIPVAVNIPSFKWQADLWWWNYKLNYNELAYKTACLIMVDKNYPDQIPLDTDWYKYIPHVEVTGVWNSLVPGVNPSLCMPLNIQVGLKQCLDKFNDDEILEIIDCDLIHFKPRVNFEILDNLTYFQPTQNFNIDDDVLYVCDLYEQWHMFSQTKNKFVIEPYVRSSFYYNGGFVPLIGTARTFKKIINDWESIHRDILTRNVDNLISWWAGMFALQAVCEKYRIKMINYDICFIPPVNELKDHHYLYHYSVDKIFNKKTYPTIDINNFPDNQCYSRIKEWLKTQ